MTRSVLAGLLLAACASRGAGAPADPLPQCGPDIAPGIDEEAVTKLAREWNARFHAVSGPRAGASADARMSLEAAKGDLRRILSPTGLGPADVVLPYFGSLDLDVAALGGVSAGDPASVDSMMPGVLVIQRNAPGSSTPRSITIRVGSEANDRHVQRFEGAYFALRVTHVSAHLLAGAWASGIRLERASGYFCAYPALA